MTRHGSGSSVLLILFTFLTVWSEPLKGQSPARRQATPLTLEDATQLALAHNQSLRALRYGIDQAKAGEITAALKPNPVFNNLNEDFPIFSPDDLTWENLRTNQEFTNSVTYMIERGGKRNQRIQVARDNTDVTIQSVADFERQLRFQVAQAYINILLAKSNLQFVQENQKNFSEEVEINKRRLQSGDLSESDYLKISLQQLQFGQDLAAAEIALVQGKAALRQLIGYNTVPDDFDVTGSLTHPKYAIGREELEKEALLTRPDFLSAQSSVQLANDTVALALANRARDVTIESEFKRNGTINGVGFGISFELPFNNRNQGEIARSRAAVSQAVETADATRVAVLTDVANAYGAYAANDQVLSLYESGYLDQALQSRDIVSYAHQRGAASLLDLLDAQRSYRNTQLAYRQTLAAYLLSVEQVNLAVGKKVMK